MLCISCYLLPFLWMTACFRIMGQIPDTDLVALKAKSAIVDCYVDVLCQ